jgi:hypothetical protein
MRRLDPSPVDPHLATAQDAIDQAARYFPQLPQQKIIDSLANIPGCGLDISDFAPRRIGRRLAGNTARHEISN